MKPYYWIAVVFGVGIASAALVSVLIHEDNFSCPEDARYCKVVLEKDGKKVKMFILRKGNYDMRVYAIYTTTTTTTSTTTTTTTTITTTTTTTSSTTTTQGSGLGVCGKVEVPCPPEHNELGIPCTMDLPCLTTTTTQGNGVGIGCARIVGCSYCPSEIPCQSQCTDVVNGCISCDPFYIGECPEGCVILGGFVPCG